MMTFDELYAAVVLTSFLGVIGVDRLAFATTFGLNAFSLDTALHHLVLDAGRTALGEFLVSLVCSDRVGVSDDLDTNAWILLEEVVEGLK